MVVSGLLSPAGNEALILLAIHQGLVRPCFSEEILEEYAGVLARPKFGFPAHEIAALLAMFRRQGELIVPKASGAVSIDPGDTKFLQCAEFRAGRLYRHWKQAAFPGLWRGANGQRR